MYMGLPLQIENVWMGKATATVIECFCLHINAILHAEGHKEIEMIRFDLHVNCFHSFFAPIECITQCLCMCFLIKYFLKKVSC